MLLPSESDVTRRSRRQVIMRAAAVVLIVLAGACSCAHRRARAAPDNPFTTSEAAVGDVTYFSDSGTAGLRALASGIWHLIPFPDGFLPHQAFSPGTAGVVGELWVVGRASTGLQLRSYRDTNADGLVEAASASVLISSDLTIMVYSVAFDPTSGALYMLHVGPGDIYRARDTNSDHVPETLSETPFVAGTWDPAYVEPQVIEYEDPETLQTEMYADGLSAKATDLSNAEVSAVYAVPVGLFRDTDGDDVADTLDYTE
jgi:hypothetical protein